MGGRLGIQTTSLPSVFLGWMFELVGGKGDESEWYLFRFLCTELGSVVMESEIFFFFLGGGSILILKVALVFFLVLFSLFFFFFSSSREK